MHQSADVRVLVRRSPMWDTSDKTLVHTLDLTGVSGIHITYPSVYAQSAHNLDTPSRHTICPPVKRPLDGPSQAGRSILAE